MASIIISKEKEKQGDGWKTREWNVKEGQLIQKITMISKVITPT